MQNKTTQPPFPMIRVANTFIERYAADAYIDHLKVQKLCYYAYGWWLTFFGANPPLSNECPQVWKYGPILNELYHIYKGSKGDWIRKQRISLYDPSDPIDRSEEDSSKMIDWIWKRYGLLSGIELSILSHGCDSPWYKEAKEHDFSVSYNHNISKEKIKAYFDELMNEQMIDKSIIY